VLISGEIWGQAIAAVCPQQARRCGGT